MITPRLFRQIHNIVPHFSVALASAALLTASARAAVVGTPNLLVNGTGESPMSVGWNVINNGGSGWSVAPASGPQVGADNDGGYFATSYTLDSRSQLIDLQAAGYSTSELDASPVISVGESVMSSPAFNNNSNGATDPFYIKVEILAADMSVIAEWDLGTAAAMIASPSTWTEMSHDFTGYGSGARYVYFEDGGLDRGFWAGNYGTGFDAGFVTVTPVPECGSVPLAAMALLGLAFHRKRR